MRKKFDMDLVGIEHAHTTQMLSGLPRSYHEQVDIFTI